MWLLSASVHAVASIGFTMTGSKQNTYGLSTPAYFCFDNLGGNAADCQLGALTHVDGRPTGIINPVADDQVRKFIRNCQLYILRAGQTYDATGRKVQ